MDFRAKDIAGKTLFYAVDAVADHFLSAFPHSKGKRKSLTYQQVKLLAALGIDIRIR